MESGSTRWQLNGADLGKVGKGMALAVAGSGLSYAIAQVSTLDAGQYVWLMPVMMMGLNIARKLVTDNT